MSLRSLTLPPLRCRKKIGKSKRYLTKDTSDVIYQVNSDGSKIEIGKRIRKGRYSERVTKEA